MVNEYIRLTSKQENVGSEAFHHCWYARIVGVNETLTDGHDTPWKAVSNLLNSIDLNEIDENNGLEIEYFEFLELAAPRLVMNQVFFHKGGKPKAYETALYVQDLIKKIIEPIRSESDYMPWTTHNLHRLNIKNVDALVSVRKHFENAAEFDYVSQGVVTRSDGDIIKMSMLDKARGRKDKNAEWSNHV